MYKQQPPGKKEAYEFALSLEQSGQELYFQMIISLATKNRIVTILQGLVGTEINHADRIQAFLEK